MTDEKRGQNRPTIPTVLVADSSTDVQRFICATLAAAGYRVVEAADGSEALDVCRRDRPDLVLLDIDTPAMDGHATLRVIRADADLHSMPVLFLSARTDGKDVATTLGLAAQSYLFTPCEPSELIARVDTALQTKATEDALARHVREIEELSTIDILTGLASRQRMETRILELAATYGPNAVATVVLIDIDDFKTINDTFGPAVGDIVLRIVAGRLRYAILDERILVCRWGIEEFLAAGVGLDANEAYDLAERLRHAISVTSFAIGADHPKLPVTVSVGCARGTLLRYAAVLEAANGALFEARQRGPDHMVMATTA